MKELNKLNRPTNMFPHLLRLVGVVYNFLLMAYTRREIGKF
jgi:hypothetical protein